MEVLSTDLRYGIILAHKIVTLADVLPFTCGLRAQVAAPLTDLIQSQYKRFPQKVLITKSE